LTALLSGPLVNGDAYPLERGEGPPTAGARLNGRVAGTGDGLGRIWGAGVAPSAADEAGEHDSEGDRDGGFVSGAGELEEEAIVAEPATSRVWDGDKMDQIKAEAHNFFLCSATTISQYRIRGDRHQRKRYPRPEDPLHLHLVSFGRQGAIDP